MEQKEKLINDLKKKRIEKLKAIYEYMEIVLIDISSI